MSEMTEIKYRSGFDGKQLAYKEFLAEKAAGNVLFLHGVKEHSGRYSRLGEFFARAGYNFYAGDLRAHGHTDTPGKTDEKDVFKSIIMDLIVWGEELKDTGLPLIIIGFSFGSFLAQRLLSLIKADAFVLCGSTYMNTADTVFGKIIADTAIAFGRGKETARIVEKLTYDKFKKKSNSNGHSAASSQNSQNGQSAQASKDELCGKPLNNYFYRSLFANSLRLYGKDMAAKNKTTPILLISGARDPVSNFGAGTKRLFDEYKKRGLVVDIKLFEGVRHNVLCDPNHFAEVESFVLEFVEKSVSPQNF